MWKQNAAHKFERMMIFMLALLAVFVGNHHVHFSGGMRKLLKRTAHLPHYIAYLKNAQSEKKTCRQFLSVHFTYVQQTRPCQEEKETKKILVPAASQSLKKKEQRELIWLLFVSLCISALPFSDVRGELDVAWLMAWWWYKSHRSLLLKMCGCRRIKS